MLLPAVGVTAVVCGLSFGIQAATFKEPTKGQLMAATVSRWFLEYRYVTAVMRIHRHGVLRSQCIQGWYPVPKKKWAQRGAAVLLSNGKKLLAIGSPPVIVEGRGSDVSDLPRAELELAGCARVMVTRLAAVLVKDQPVTVRDAKFHGRGVLELRLPTHPTKISLLVEPKGRKPVGVIVRGRGGVRGTSEIRLQKLTSTQVMYFRQVFHK